MGKNHFFQEALTQTLGIEKGFSDHRNDPGGKTMFGITEHSARKYGYLGEMKDLPLAIAADIYYQDYWLKNNLDLVADVNKELAFEIFDTAVNGGQPSLWLQEGLNLFNRRGKDWPDLLEDGDIGRITIGALRGALVRRGSDGMRVLLKYLNAKQGVRYAYLARRNEKFEDFVYGWFLKRI